MKFKREIFKYSIDLVIFVNKNKISKDNIQSIEKDKDGSYVLFYWNIYE